MASNLEIKITGEGTRKDISDALKLLADNLFSDNIEEIYNIDGAAYNDMCIEVSLIDKDNI